jgi:hypothetical protein
MTTKGSGHLFQRNSIWCLQIRKNGKSRTISLKTENREEAERKRSKISDLYQNGEPDPVRRNAFSRRPEPGRDIWQELADQFLSNVQPAPGAASSVQYRHCLSKLASWARQNGILLPEILSPSEAQAFVEHASLSVSEKTLAKMVMRLRRTYRFLTELNICRRNPFLGVKVSQRLDARTTQDQIEKIRKWMETASSLSKPDREALENILG